MVACGAMATTVTTRLVDLPRWWQEVLTPVSWVAVAVVEPTEEVVKAVEGVEAREEAVRQSEERPHDQQSPRLFLAPGCQDWLIGWQ